MGKLKVDKESVRKAATKLGDAVDDYKDFGKKPFQDEIAMLKSMNADFTEQLKTLLKNTNDSNVTIIKDLEGAAKKAKEIIDKFEEIDEEAANKISSK